MIAQILSGGWAWVAALLAGIAALAASYFGGKKIGKVQTQAKADVAAAKFESDSVADVAKRQSDNQEKANEVKQSNSSLTDNAARDRMRNSQFNSKD